MIIAKQRRRLGNGNLTTCGPGKRRWTWRSRTQGNVCCLFLSEQRGVVQGIYMTFFLTTEHQLLPSSNQKYSDLRNSPPPPSSPRKREKSSSEKDTSNTSQLGRKSPLKQRRRQKRTMLRTAWKLIITGLDMASTERKQRNLLRRDGMIRRTCSSLSMPTFRECYYFICIFTSINLFYQRPWYAEWKEEGQH